LQSLDKKTKGTWACDYCLERKLNRERNCFGKFKKAVIKITKNLMFDQCPISMIDKQSAKIYEIMQLSLRSGMGGYLPNQLLELPNIWFECLQVIGEAESEFEGEADGRQ